MGNKFLKTFLVIGLVAAAAFLQGTNFNIAGVKPNWTLAVLLVLAFFINDFIFYFILVLLASVILRFQPSFSWELAVWLLIVLTGFFAARRLPWRGIVNFSVMICAGTVGFYLLIDHKFVYGNIGVWSAELIYNVLVGLSLFLTLRYVFQSKY